MPRHPEPHCADADGAVKQGRTRPGPPDDLPCLTATAGRATPTTSRSKRPPSTAGGFPAPRSRTAAAIRNRAHDRAHGAAGEPQRGWGFSPPSPSRRQRPSKRRGREEARATGRGSPPPNLDTCVVMLGAYAGADDQRGCQDDRLVGSHAALCRAGGPGHAGALRVGLPAVRSRPAAAPAHAQGAAGRASTCRCQTSRSRRGWTATPPAGRRSGRGCSPRPAGPRTSRPRTGCASSRTSTRDCSRPSEHPRPPVATH